MTARKPSAAPVAKRYAVRWHDPNDPRPWLAGYGEHGAAWHADPAKAMPFATRAEARAMAARWQPRLAVVVEDPTGREAARRAS